MERVNTHTFSRNGKMNTKLVSGLLNLPKRFGVLAPHIPSIQFLKQICAPHFWIYYGIFWGTSQLQFQKGCQQNLQGLHIRGDLQRAVSIHQNILHDFRIPSPPLLVRVKWNLEIEVKRSTPLGLAITTVCSASQPACQPEPPASQSARQQ